MNPDPKKVGATQQWTNYSFNGAENLSSLSDVFKVKIDTGHLVLRLGHDVIGGATNAYMLFVKCENVVIEGGQSYSFYCESDFLVKGESKEIMNLKNHYYLVAIYKAIVDTFNNCDGYISCYLQEILKIRKKDHPPLIFKGQDIIDLIIKWHNKTNPI